MNLNILVIVTSYFLISGCSQKIEALGADNEMIVICSDTDKEIMIEFVHSVFDDTLFTPQPEPYFNIKFVKPEDFLDLKTQAYVLVGAIGDDLHNDGVKLVKKLLPESQYNDTQKNDPVLFTRDLYAKNQLFLIINAQNKKQLLSFIPTKKEWLKKQYSDQFAIRQSKYMFNDARRENVEKELAQKYGWTMKIPWGWEVIKDSSEVGLFWLGKEMPYQWISVHWEDGKTIDVVDGLDIGNTIWAYPETFYNHIRFHDYKFKMRKVYFNRVKAWKITGVWESIKEPQGGPFLSYIFYDKSTDKTYHLNMLIYHPGKDKSIFMRQMDLIAKTFRVTKPV
ncbi:MAG: DUF4837 family protein [Candidatus Marinimicrobia bacterium]|nr:DUF4837 family protein [Candidatus Neomarinimicrobiota bacterium]